MVFSTNTDYMRRLEHENSPAEAPTLSPEQQRLTVSRDAKMRKGKVVTLVQGFEGTTEDLEMLGKRLKTSCGVGGSAKDGLIIVQGDLKDRVLALLLEWGYTKSKAR